MKYYTIQESYKDGLLVRKSSMRDYEMILNLEKSIKKQMQMYLDNDFKVVRNGNDIVFSSLNPDFDMHIIRHKKYENNAKQCIKKQKFINNFLRLFWPFKK